MTYITANELSSKLRLTCWLIIFQSKVPQLVQHVPLCQCWGVEAWGGVKAEGGRQGEVFQSRLPLPVNAWICIAPRCYLAV